jgi:hypothetical protein
MNFANQKFFKKDFSGQDLRDIPMHDSEFLCCNFDNANLSGTNCSKSIFSGSTMIGTNCKNTNFAHAKLGCIFEPSDAYGMTLTLSCHTFRGMVVSAFWWYCWQQFGLLMVPQKDKDGVDPKDSLIASLGVRKYLALNRMFREREL